MMNVKVIKGTLSPSNNINSILPWQYEFRLTGNFTGENVVTVCTMEEAVWWNRPFAEDSTFLTKGEDGLYSYNFPIFAGVGKTIAKDGTFAYKTDYNILLNRNAIVAMAHIDTSGWAQEERDSLNNFFDAVYRDSIIELGADSTKLSTPNNDMLYNGKKFAGRERIWSNNVYEEDGIITCLYLPEKNIFNRLTGEYANSRGITGITEEVPVITKQKLCEKIYQKFVEFFQS